MEALVPYKSHALQRHEDYRMIEEEYDAEMRQEKDRFVKKERIDIKKMIKEHEAGTERLNEMSNRRSKLM